jgi:hypothetical protein
MSVELFRRKHPKIYMQILRLGINAELDDAEQENEDSPKK